MYDVFTKNVFYSSKCTQVRVGSTGADQSWVSGEDVTDNPKVPTCHNGHL